MIQFNLLPDVKLEYIKATYRRRIISFICFVVAGAFLFVFVMMFMFVRVNQTSQLKDLDDDISTNVEKLRETPDLDKILTIQNQLNSLPELHEQKIMASRFFDYVVKLNPANNKFTSVDMNLEEKTITLEGEADTTATVNKLTDTLKFAKYQILDESASSSEEKPAFNSVVLQNFSINSATNNTPSVTYELSFSYDDNIFKNTAIVGNPINNSVSIIIPSIISTPSEQLKPTNLQTTGGSQ
mgnify:CR=1 FL=1